MNLQGSINAGLVQQCIRKLLVQIQVNITLKIKLDFFICHKKETHETFLHRMKKAALKKFEQNPMYSHSIQASSQGQEALYLVLFVF